MAQFTCIGIQDTTTWLEKAADCPDDVKKDILKAMGAVAVEAQKRSADEAGIHDKGTTRDSIGLDSPRVTASGGSIMVSFKGTRKDEHHKTPTRNAEVAFINEFGKTGQPARPFVLTANEKNADRIVAAGEEVYDRWLSSQH